MKIGLKFCHFRDCFTICFLLCCCVSLVHGQISPTEDDTFTAILKSETYGLSAESVDEIIQIRKRLGGGTRLEFDQPFTSRQASRKSAPTTVSQFDSVIVSEPLDPATSATESERLFFEMINRTSEPKTHCLNCLAAQVANADGEDIPELRSVARRIDELAAELEEINQFEHADNLRLRAASLRQQARISNRAVDSNLRCLR